MKATTEFYADAAGVIRLSVDEENKHVALYPAENGGWVARVNSWSVEQHMRDWPGDGLRPANIKVEVLP